MDTSKLKKFAQYARRSLIEQVKSKLKLVLAEDSAARREHPQAVKELEAKQKEFGDDQKLIEQVAYTWFNRFCALRFMDANQYNRIMVVSPIAGQFQPEILAEAKAGHLDDSVFDAKTSDKIRGLLLGAIPSRDGQAEAYRLIIVAMCNAYHRLMPYLFERIEDYTELLMPEDLLSGNSILAYTREAMTPENCESVESIGWLYQFYISEQKDQVFEGLKKNKKITRENIPAATQLFTPHWIVKYLVENSLGRLWMLNNPSSKVIEQMDYYIKAVEEEEEFLKISSPEELKICDPAAGSGHMLTYAYDLLYTIYLDANYDPVDIPELILTKNLYGIEIDERAAELAAFALSMKAMKGNPFDDSNNRRRFFRKPIEPNICRLEKVKIDDDALEEYIEFAGKELFTTDVRKTLKEFEEADNFGSLIQPTLKDPTELREKLTSKDAQVDLFLKDTHESILKILKQAKYLSPIYHVVIANPPYMGSGGMNKPLATWCKKSYKYSHYDMLSMFIERGNLLLVNKGYNSMITMQNWMFLSRFENFRAALLDTSTIMDLMQIGFNTFPEMNSKVALGAAFVLKKSVDRDYLASYIDLNQAPPSSDKSKVFFDSNIRRDYHITAREMRHIPGRAITYSASPNVINAFRELKKVGDVVTTREGLATGCNELFIRTWSEVEIDKICFGVDSEEEFTEHKGKWAPYVKGGGFRRWYGNFEFVLDWDKQGEAIKNFKDESTGRIRSHNYNGEYAFKQGFTWTGIGIEFGVRKVPKGFMFDAKGPMGFTNNNLDGIVAVLNTSIAKKILKMLAPTLDFKIGHVLNIPFDENAATKLEKNCKECIQISMDDWNSMELSWNFKGNPLINAGKQKVAEALQSVKNRNQRNVNRLKELEEENNALALAQYGLEEEISSTVEIKQITLLANPYYLYGADKDENDLELLQKRDYLLDLFSYFVGCIFGRFSRTEKGIKLAAQQNMHKLLEEMLNDSAFPPDKDNVVPIINFEGDWFEDDISERFKEFLKDTFGEENFFENLAFIEEAIGKDIKKYFIKDFYADHVKRYKKRPIYWMFSSPKGSFNALIYMHRYQPDTVSIVLNDYLREFRRKLEARKDTNERIEINPSTSQKDKTKAIKTISKINKVLEEINDYEHDVLYPLAGENIEIDLDDGVKHNYPLFGKALKKITGLS